MRCMGKVLGRCRRTELEWLGPELLEVGPMWLPTRRRVRSEDCKFELRAVGQLRQLHHGHVSAPTHCRVPFNFRAVGVNSISSAHLHEPAHLHVQIAHPEYFMRRLADRRVLTPPPPLL